MLPILRLSAARSNAGNARDLLSGPSGRSSPVIPPLRLLAQAYGNLYIIVRRKHSASIVPRGIKNGS